MKYIDGIPVDQAGTPLDNVPLHVKDERLTYYRTMLGKALQNENIESSHLEHVRMSIKDNLLIAFVAPEHYYIHVYGPTLKNGKKLPKYSLSEALEQNGFDKDEIDPTTIEATVKNIKRNYGSSVTSGI